MSEIKELFPPNEWITTAEAAKMLGVSHFFFTRNRTLPNHIPYAKIGGRIKYKVADILAYVDAAMHRPAAEEQQ